MQTTRQTFHQVLLYTLVLLTIGGAGGVWVGCAKVESGFDSGVVGWMPDDARPILPNQNDREGRNDAPIFRRIGPKQAEVGQVFEQKVEVIDPDGDDLQVRIDNAPPASSFDPASWVFTWTPAPTDLGQKQIVFIASDGTVESAETMVVTVSGMGESENLPPQVQPVGEQMIYAQEPFALLLNVSDPNNDPLTFDLLEGSPQGVSINSTGTLLWEPTLDQAGQRFRVVFSVSDGVNQVVGEIPFLVLNKDQDPPPMDMFIPPPPPRDMMITNPPPPPMDRGMPTDRDMNMDPIPSPQDMNPPPPLPDMWVVPDNCEPAYIFNLDWFELAPFHYRFTASPANCVETVSFYVNNVYLGETSGAPSAQFDYLFPSSNEGHVVEVAGYTQGQGIVSFAKGLMDIGTGLGMYIQQTGSQLYRMGIVNAPPNVAYLEVYVDNYLLTDLMTQQTSSSNLEISYQFQYLGYRQFDFVLYNSSGAEMNRITRWFEMLE